MVIDEALIRSPVRTPETAAFWDAANDKRLLFGRCMACGSTHYYPRRVCPFCLSTEVEWKDACGRGEIYAYSLFRKAEPPYVSAWILLDEGLAILSTIVECDTNLLHIGKSVELVFRPAPDGQAIPVFRPL